MTSLSPNVLHDNFHLMEHFPTPVALQWLLLHSALARRYLQVVDPNALIFQPRNVSA